MATHKHLTQQKMEAEKSGPTMAAGDPPSAAAQGPMETEATEYLKEHRIPELLENITSAVVFSRPEDPRVFILEHLQQLQRAKSDPAQHSPPLFIDETNVSSVFGMLDLARSGSITHQQYLDAMKSLGVSRYNHRPAGTDLNRISRDTFTREANAALRAASATYSDS